MVLNENRPPRLILKPMLAKRSSHTFMREVNGSSKHLEKSKSLSSVVRTPTRTTSTVKSKSPVKTTIISPNHASPSPKEIPDDEHHDARKKASEEAHPDPNAHSHPTLTKQNSLFEHPFPSISARSQVADTPPIPPKDPRRLNISTEDTDADDEDSDHTEGKYACQFTSPDSPNKAQTPSSVKSVRWDPAIISHGRVASGRFLSSDSTGPPTPSPRPRDNFGDALRSLRKLDKQDQQVICKLLQQIDASSTDDEWIEPLSGGKGERHINPHIETSTSSSKKLNPKAPDFQDSSKLKKQVEENKEYSKGESSSPPSINKTYAPSPAVVSTPPNMLRTRKDPKEPTWVNIFNPPAPKDMPKGLPKLWHPPRSSAPFTAPNIDQSAFHLSPLNARRPPFKPRANKGPLVDISANFIPPEDGTCREAQPIPWSQSLLDSFAAKYPQTGHTNPKARRQAPGHMRRAAAIQQQLELLIYQEKEKNAVDEKMGIRKPQPTKKECNETGNEILVGQFSSAKSSAKNLDQS
ncbi:hypothetical protein BJ875DRAFT_420180 [Amylocarpus encephaloides]|uniref:Uncharacterized protein n=1 Tax=Amylocarpus encephaloides TaxID=45428 RepID=A0A9P8C7J0_9HELO|nr:hypothetical protein BJ875DRAFT_420180 [Amylocarpus encephaloides]